MTIPLERLPRRGGWATGTDGDGRRRALAEVLRGTPYASYAYSYPHKTAYRPLDPPVPLTEAWAQERRDALFLYLHVPFCEMRCGFCNLFTTAHPLAEMETAYLDALQRQARQVREALGGDAGFARMAIGGGTPTYLDMGGLSALFDIAEKVFGADLRRIPISVETSPRTAEPEKLRLLRDRGVGRVSIGVQSFIEAEVAAIGRAQKTALVERALTNIRDAGIPTLNLDLMYGLPEQTPESWHASLRAALRFAPEEIYLYPLYVRPLTGMDRSHQSWDDQRLDLYRRGRAFLLSAGYEQVSMRMFRAARAVPAKPEGPVYCCQEDGMVGLGCGARSYTTALHYSTEFAVGRQGVRGILADYVSKLDAAFSVADYGTHLDGEEQRRRWVINSLLQAQGMEWAAYRRRFGTYAPDDLPLLAELEAHSLATGTAERLRLTDAGIERSDTIGPWLYSEAVRATMERFDLR